MSGRILISFYAVALTVTPLRAQAPSQPLTKAESVLAERRLVYRSPHVRIEDPSVAPVMASDEPEYCPAPLVAEHDSCWRPTGCFWASGDYLLSWLSGADLPPLVTSSPLGTPRQLAGVLGAPNTEVLFGNRTVNDEIRSGLRLAAGYWLDPSVRGPLMEGQVGVEAGFMVLESQATLFRASLNPIIGRPFTDARKGTSEAVLIAFPDSSTGSVDVRAGSGNLYEVHLDFTEKVVDNSSRRLETILGYRFFGYDDRLRVQQNIFPTDNNFVTGTRITTTDEFTARNEFHGCDLGVRGQFVRQNISLDLLAKVALGFMRCEVDVAGKQQVAVPGESPLQQTGGVYALATNIGSHSSSEFQAVPELGAALHWQLSENVRVSVGYSALFLAGVARAADQIDFNINPDLFPPEQQSSIRAPRFSLERDNLWIQNINFGLAFSY